MLFCRESKQPAERRTLSQPEELLDQTMRATREAVAVLLLTQGFDVGSVFLSAGRPFVGNEILTADETHRRLSILAGNLTRVGLFPRNSANSCNHVDAYGGNAKLDDFARDGEVVLRQIKRAEPKVAKSGKDSLGVFVDRPDEQVDVAGKTRCAVEGQGIAADDEVFNFVFVEQLEQLSEVGANLHRPDA